MRADKNRHKKMHGWITLLSVLVALYIFAVAIGPWLQHRIPTFDAIVQVIQDNDIDSGAYFYSEIRAASQGESYLSQSLSLSHPDHYGITLPFLAGLASCLLILLLGWRYIMPE